MSEQVHIGSAEEFAAFLANYDTAEFRATVAATAAVAVPTVNASLDTYFSEMVFGHRFLSTRLPAGRLRIMEIGAGLGLLSIWLARQGHEVVAVEPAGQAFGLFEASRQEITRGTRGPMPKMVEAPVEELTPEQMGVFDFVFSINVMEHVLKLDEAVAAVSKLLKPGGIWVNTCANYGVPYEPHYSIPMVPFSPALTRRLFARRIEANLDVWGTLNFISVGMVCKVADRHGLKAAFEPGTLHDALVRIGQDSKFGARHASGVAGMVHAALSATRLISLTKKLPASLSTPMVFHLSRK